MLAVKSRGYINTNQTIYLNINRPLTRPRLKRREKTVKETIAFRVLYDDSYNIFFLNLLEKAVSVNWADIIVFWSLKFVKTVVFKTGFVDIHTYMEFAWKLIGLEIKGV